MPGGVVLEEGELRMGQHDDLPIFFDQRGRRWKFVKALLIIFVDIIALLGGYSIPRVLDAGAVTKVSTDAAQTSPTTTVSPAQLTAAINQSNVPVIGTGPLVRVDEIQTTNQGLMAAPLYGAGNPITLSDEQISIVGQHKYAIEYYGQASGKQIALTFDDGPDPSWTPKILDELSKFKVRATFFEIGREIVKYPAISQRIVREGHVIGNHTFDHINFHTVGDARGEQELNQTERVIRAVTGYGTAYARLPYGGSNSQSLRDFVQGILEAQQLGYVVTYYDFDSNDWQFTPGSKASLPAFSGAPLVVLLHDGGGNRSSTIAYVDQLVVAARAQGYTFVTLNNLYPEKPALFSPHPASIEDKLSYLIASAYIAWPRQLLYRLFFITIISILLSMVMNVLLAALNIHLSARRKYRDDFAPLVSIVVPAFNEAAVLEKSISSLLQSDYSNIEIVIVDDGSTDNTWYVARGLTFRQLKVRAYHQTNGGKARALNYGIDQAKGDIIVAIDADTIFASHTISKLVRHFIDPKVGAVAGVVKVGNVRNLLTSWQALDYIIGIYIERNAQALLKSVMIVPGACGAWRKAAVKAVGGYSTSTLAEDFDLTLALHRAGYKIEQDNEAVGFTEAPLTVDGLFRQRFRWIFGDIQAFWKYRHMFLRQRYKWVGMYFLPLAIYSIIAPLLFGPVLLLIEIENILNGNLFVVLLFFTAGITLQFVMAALGILLARERPRYLLAVPVTRFLYGPLRSFILYRSFVHAVQGAYEGWNKLQRTGTVHYEPPEVEAKPRIVNAPAPLN